MRHLILFIFILFSASAFSALKVTTYNIKTFDASPGLTNKKELTKILKDLDFDLLGVQEIVNIRSFRELIKEEFPGFRVITTQCGGAGRQHIGFVYDFKKFQLEKAYEDSRISQSSILDSFESCHNLRPALIGVFKERKTQEKFAMLGVHLKAGGGTRNYVKRKKQYKKLAKVIKELKANNLKNIIALGDFNTTGFNLRDEDYDNFNRLLQNVNMDTTSDQISCSSYWSGTNRNDNIEESSILDHIVVTNKFLGRTKSSTNVGSHCAKLACSFASSSELGISYEQVSDHCPITTTFY